MKSWLPWYGTSLACLLASLGLLSRAGLCVCIFGGVRDGKGTGLEGIGGMNGWKGDIVYSIEIHFLR